MGRGSAGWPCGGALPMGPDMSAHRFLVLAAVPYAAWLVFAYDYHFIDHVNLAFHEAGHVFSRPFGMTAHVLGGTLLQLAMPAICAGHFARRAQWLEALLCCVWVGESLMYTGWYMRDAVAMALPLAGGGEIHDWNWLLRRFGGLGQCRLLAGMTHALASVIVLASLGGAVWVAFRGNGARQ